MLKSFLLFAAVVLLVLASATAPAHSQAAASNSGAKAKKLYEQDCALCHGSTGDGKTDLGKDMQLTMMDWTDPKSLSGMSDQAIFDAIRKGKGKMPPEEESRASNDSVHYLIIYIRKMAKEPGATAAPAAAPADQPAPATTPATAPAPSR